jgi:hypothetical protein
MPATDVNVCFAMLVDPDGTLTPDPADDMSPECVEYNFNLEFVVERRAGFPGVDGTAVVPECVLADCPDLDCPGIGG